MENISSILILTAIIIVLLIFLKIRKIYNYWTQFGITGPKPTFPFGNVKDLLTLKLSETSTYEEIYNNYKNEKYVGLYFLWKPMLLIRDPELVKKILVSDFDHFTDHPDISSGTGTDSIDCSVFTMKGEVWKDRRQYLSKLFTLKKLKEKVNILKDVLKKIVDDDLTKTDVNIEDITQKFTLRGFISVYFGIDISETENGEAIFVHGSELFVAPTMLCTIKSLTCMVFPQLYRLLGLKTWPTIIWKNMADFTKNVIAMYKDKSIDAENLITYIIEMEKGGTSSGERISFDEMIGHVFVFFTAGHHTTQYTLCHILVQLAHHSEVQEKLRKEVDAVLKDSQDITYENLQDMTYMNQVISEVLRIYPILGILKRVCTKPYKIDENYTIEEGTNVILSAAGFMHDSKYFSEPLEFKPERFSDTADIPDIYFPFGSGPRICIGKKFAEIEMKYFLAVIMSQYEILPSPRMKMPMSFEKKTIFIAYRPAEPMLVQFRKRTDIVFNF